MQKQPLWSDSRQNISYILNPLTGYVGLILLQYRCSYHMACHSILEGTIEDTPILLLTEDWEATHSTLDS